MVESDTTVVIEMKGVSLGYHQKTIVSHVDLTLRSGQVTCLLGPNGVGKTTLFKTLLGILPPLAGSIRINGKNIDQLSVNDFARLIAYVPQAHNTPFPYTVRDVVLFGRTAHLSLFASPGKNDLKIADRCLDLLEIRALADRNFTELSGGERQMVIIARALAQEASFMILDEPSSSLDYGNQIRVIKKIKELGEQSIGILMATHSPDHAFMLGADVIMLNQGGVFDCGKTENVITSSSLAEIYGVNVQIFNTPANGCPSRKVCAPTLF